MKSLRKFPDPFLAEICAQPDATRRAAEGLSAQTVGLRNLAQAASGIRTLLFTGMGASYHACYPAVTELAARGVAAHLVDTAELLHFRRPLLNGDTLIVSVSQSGESAEVVRLAEEVRAQSGAGRPFLVAITNGTGNALFAQADVGLDSGAGIEHGPSTMTFSASLVVLSGVVRVLAGADPPEAVERTARAAEQAARIADRLLADPEEQAGELLAWHRGRDTTVLLGRGPARAASEMGALLLKESAGIPAEALETAQFRHGPLELAGPDMAAVVIATEPETLSLDLALADELVHAGAATLVVTTGEPPKGALGVRVGAMDRTLAPSVSIAPVQLLAWRLAVERGRTPGVLTRASKVTTHE